jgi:hypothetical protein
LNLRLNRKQGRHFESARLGLRHPQLKNSRPNPILRTRPYSLKQGIEPEAQTPYRFRPGLDSARFFTVRESAQFAYLNLISLRPDLSVL